MQLFRVGLCAFGMSGRVFHAPFLKQHPGFHIAGIVERSKNDSQKLEKKFSERIKPLREERTRLKVECDQIPTKRQTLENQKHAIEMEEQELMKTAVV